MRQRSALAMVIILAAIAGGRTAAADEPAPIVAAPPLSPSAPRAWYGWQILIADAASTAMLILATEASGAGGTTLGVGGFAVYVTGGAFTHAMHHRRDGVIGGSIALRLGLPLIGALVGGSEGASSASQCRSDAASANHGSGMSLGSLCGLAAVGDMVLGGGIGMLVASVLDVAVLSWADSVPNAPPGSASLRVLPSIGAVRDTDRRSVPTLTMVGAF